MGFSQETFNDFVDIAQQQMAMPEPIEAEYSSVEIPVEEVNQLLQLMVQYWWLGAIIGVGLITCGIAIFRAGKKIPFVAELMKIWGVRK